jgi:hypothetical protein
MSGLGLTRFERLSVEAVGRVRLRGCRRGFGKLSMYGDRFAMLLEPTDARAPIRCEPIAPAVGEAGGVEALALTVGLPDLVAIAGREGYPAAACHALAEQAAAAGRDVGSHLWTLLEGARFDCAAYRRALFAAAGATSPHYIPHPVATSGVPAIAFLAPGAEGTGCDAVVPIRVQTAMTRLMTVAEVWRVKPNADQLTYIAMCLLAEVHGIGLTDVCTGLTDDAPVLRRVRARVAEEVAAEPARFREMLGLTIEGYAAQLPPRTRPSHILPVTTEVTP